MHRDIFTPQHYLPDNQLELVPSGSPYFDCLLQLIKRAEKRIYFQVYIFEEDATGKEVAEALKQARKRNVEVYLAVDSYGSRSLSPEFVSGLKSSGIQFKFFSPLPKHVYMFRMGRRMHNKAVVIDETEALVGGINIADKYRGTKEEPAWLDFSVYVKGPVCMELAHMCKRIHGRKYFGQYDAPDLKKQKAPAENVLARLALNDWLRRKNQISAGYRAAFRKSEKSIVVVASYFLPSRNLRITLRKAAERGVRVAVLLPGVSDVPLALRATRYLYRWLLRNKIEIYEWHDSILHGKLAVVDRKWATIGSYNLNHLSEYSSIEMNIEALDKDFAGGVADHLADILKKSEKIPADTFRNGGPVGMFLDWFSYTLARWIMLFLFYLVMRDYNYFKKL